MADSEIVLPIKILKNSKILVNVDEVLQDILVVSYAIESRLYEGVLLDSAKNGVGRSLPCGVAVATLAGLYATSSPRGGDAIPATAGATPAAPDEDRLYSVGQRFSYGGVAATPHAPHPPASAALAPAAPFHMRRAVRPPARYKNSKMTVRLRPRQVLCSKCRSICNENSENVDVSRRTRRGGGGGGGGGGAGPGGGGGGGAGADGDHDKKLSPRPLFSENQRDNQPRMGSPPGADAKLCASLIPKLSRLQPSEISTALGSGGGAAAGGGGGPKLKLVGGYWARHVEPAAAPAPPPAPRPPPAVPALAAVPPPAAPAAAPLAPDGPRAAPPPPRDPAPPAARGPEDDEDGDADDSDGQVSVGGREEEERTGMVLRKKRSVGSMEDLWDESVFEAEAAEGAKRARTATPSPSPSPLMAPVAPGLRAGAATTPVIKISFGRQGEGGTVLKIPSRVRTAGGVVAGGAAGGVEGAGGVGGDSDGEGQQQQQRQEARAKAAKKALKKAKREARRKLLGGGGASPGRSPARSPAHAHAHHGHHALASPVHAAAFEALYRRRHKHKVKHKKKHREDRRHGRDVVDDAAAAAVAGLPLGAVGADGEAGACLGAEVVEVDGRRPGDTYSAIKERCLKQKLSISLKRLNANAYMRCDLLHGPQVVSGQGSKSPTEASSCSNSEELSESEGGGGGGGRVPGFPAPPSSLLLRSPPSHAHAVASCLTGDGRRMTVGDVVWGKIHGFPWWPGKVLSITLPHKEDGATPQAHVAWYGSSTSSLMPCDQLSPFLETFKARYNKKKRGPYKEAIRQATSEARRDAPVQPDSTLQIATSPREVNVAS